MHISETGLNSLEILEPRQLLTASVANGILTIIGTSKADKIVVNQNATIIGWSINKEKGSAPVNTIKAISIDCAGRDDRVEMQMADGGNAVRVRTTIMGSAGNDSIQGGIGPDSILGGSGSDTLDGNFGVDTLSGGDAIDTVTYAARTNQVFVSLDGVQNDGETKEFDQIVSTEIVIGGSGDDTFTIPPKDTPGEYFGGPGIDTVDYGFLEVPPDGFIEVSLDDVTNDGRFGTDNAHADIENIYGSKFDDVLIGNDSDNALLGNDGSDELHGGGGNDFLSGGADSDSMFGENDDDFFINANFPTQDHPFDNDAVNGGPGFDFSEDDQVDEGSTSGVEGDLDIRKGPNGAPPPGLAQMKAFASGLVALDVAAPVTITGTSGADRIVINQNATDISYVVNGVATTVPASSVSNITVECAGGNDFVVMSKGDGTNMVAVPTNVSGGNGNDTIKGGTNRDTLGGGNGNDLMVGNAGNDRMVGGLGSDNFQAGAGNDVMIGDTSTADTTGFGGDNFEGGPGTDTIDYTTRTDALSITMDDDVANDGGNGGVEGDNVHTDVENILSGTGNDSIVGNASSNLLSGSEGNDSLRGGTGLDKLIGGLGTDTLFGNADVDLMLMSDGSADRFDSALNATGIVLIDFANGDINVDLSSTSGRALGTAG